MTNVSPGMIAMVGLFAWAIYRRIRRNIGRQRLRPGRVITSIVIISLASALILTASLLKPTLALGFGGGLVLGAALALLGLRHTKFETTEDGHYYTPNTYIGVGLSVLLLARMAYRIFLIQGQLNQPAGPQAFQSPLTQFIIGLTLGYYLAYYIGLFVHTHDKKPGGQVS